MEHKSFVPSGVCARLIEFDYQDGKIYNLKFTGGCNGNLKAIGKLCEGMEMEKVVEILEGNTCREKNTSCTDQLTKAIKEVL